MVAPPPHGARMTKPSASSCSRRDDPGRVRGGECGQQVAAVLAGRFAVERRHRVEVVRLERANDGLARVDGGRREARCLHRPVPGLHGEAEPFVERLARVRGHEDQRSAPGCLRRLDRCLRERASQPPPARRRRHPDRPDPGHGSVDRHDPGADDRPVIVLGDERTALGVRDSELEPRSPVAPVVGEDGRDGRLDVGGGHRSKAWLHRLIVGTECRARLDVGKVTGPEASQAVDTCVSLSPTSIRRTPRCTPRLQRSQ